MSISEPFIRRPIATTLLTLAIALSGSLAFNMLPVASLPQVDSPTISISGSLPGASPEIVASSIATPLERELGHIAAVTEMTSSSSLGSTSITLQFDLNRNIDAAARDVEAAINAARSNLPANLPSNPSYRKVNPSDAPIMIIALTSDVMSKGQMYDAASTVLAQKISQVDGVGQVTVGGSSLPGVRVEVNPTVLNKYNIGLEDIRTALANANSNVPKGHFSDNTHAWTVDDNDQLFNAVDYQPLIVAYRNGAPVRVADVANVVNSVEDIHTAGYANGKPSVLLIISREPGANIIETVDRLTALMPTLQNEISPSIKMKVVMDRTTTIRASIVDVEETLIIAIVLVIIVVFVFLQNWRATLIPIIAVPISIIGTFAGMYLLGFSINLLTLFGLVLAIGIVVDDAIVVLENVERLMATEKLSPKKAAIKAMGEVTGPVIAIVLVLCAVFIPVSFMGGLAGQMYKQFAVTIAISVTLSGIVALTLTPALCALILKPGHHEPMLPFRIFNRAFERLTDGYAAGVAFFLKRVIVGCVLVAGLLGVTGYLFYTLPGSLVPEEDQGVLFQIAILPPAASLTRTQAVMDEALANTEKLPGIENVFAVSGFDLLSGGLKSSAGVAFVTLKDWSERKTPELDARNLAGPLIGANMGIKDAMVLAFNPPPIQGLSTTGGFEVYVQDRSGKGVAGLSEQAQKLVAAASKRPELASVRTTLDTNVPQFRADLDREKAKALGVPINSVFDAMQATFGSLYVNDFTLYGRNYQVNLQSEAPFRESPDDLRQVFVRSDSGKMIPLDALIKVARVIGPDQLERYNAFNAAKITGNPAPGYTSGDAIKAMQQVAAETLPEGFQIAWTGSAYQELETSGAGTQAMIFGVIMVFLILAAQYEKWSLPLAVITAIPFALFGALLATYLRGLTNDVYFQIGMVTLIGLAAKNAILIVEFAVLKRKEGMGAAEAALEAARLRFRPIVMTSLAFILGVVPLAISTGAGSASRHAIGTGVIGGMLAATFIATFFIPMFYRLIAWKQPKPDEGDEDAAIEHRPHAQAAE